MVSGVLSRRTEILVAIPNVPSEPMNAPRKSNPALSRRSLPSQVISPSGRTTSVPNTWFVVTP